MPCRASTNRVSLAYIDICPCDEDRVVESEFKIKKNGHRQFVTHK